MSALFFSERYNIGAKYIVFSYGGKTLERSFKKQINVPFINFLTNLALKTSAQATPSKEAHVLLHGDSNS